MVVAATLIVDLVSIISGDIVRAMHTFAGYVHSVMLCDVISLVKETTYLASFFLLLLILLER